MHELPKVGLNVIYLALVIYNPDRGDPGHINTAKGGPGEEELPGWKTGALVKREVKGRDEKKKPQQKSLNDSLIQ